MAKKKVCDASQVEVSPLENAISVVENKNQELRTLISQYQHKQLHGNINLLSMCLNGVIDAAVNGGIARYQEVRHFSIFVIAFVIALSLTVNSWEGLSMFQLHVIKFPSCRNTTSLTF